MSASKVNLLDAKGKQDGILFVHGGERARQQAILNRAARGRERLENESGFNKTDLGPSGDSYHQPKPESCAVVRNTGCCRIGTFYCILRATGDS